jgi:hypothetical protein
MLHAMAFGNFLTDFCRRCSASLSRQGLRALGAPSEYGAALSRIRTHTQRDLDLVTGFIEPQGITNHEAHKLGRSPLSWRPDHISEGFHQANGYLRRRQ